MPYYVICEHCGNECEDKGTGLCDECVAVENAQWEPVKGPNILGAERV